MTASMVDFSHSNVDSRLDSGRELSDDPDDESMDISFIVVGKKCRNNVELQKALQHYAAPVIYSDTGLEYINEEDDDTIFVLDNFEGDIYQRLHRAECRIMGPPVIIKCAANNERLPCNSRPLYCTSMRGLVLCFTGFKVKEDLCRLAALVHFMGGSIRRDFSCRVTHLIANCTVGEKYRVAVSMGSPIMTEDWVHKAWEIRDKITMAAVDEDLMHCKMSPFYFSVLSFYGFSKDDQRQMEEVTVQNGGSVVEPGAPTATHLVVDEHSVRHIDFEVPPRVHIVRAEWFWASIQMDACADESMYTFEEAAPLPPPDTPNTKSKKSTPRTLSGSKSRKRKRLRENLAQLASEGEVDTPMYKRRSSEVAKMSFSASFLDVTADTSVQPNNAELSVVKELTPTSPPSNKENKITARQQTVTELFLTEKNYVGILHTILKTFKEEIERTDQPGGPLLSPTDVKLIFGKIPPIYDAHMRMRDELSDIVNNWREDRSVGDVILKHADVLIRSYPPFVNFFENTKETIAHCQKTKPRFHAFLKVCQNKVECGRQTLTELLIRPVQRLPSVLLLLKDILKRTDTANADHENLEKAISTLEEVMTHINEDRRIAEGHQTMFDVINDIENCPPNLLSSHRTLISRINVIEVTNELIGRGDHLSIFVFSDSLEMCKRRVKVLNSKSPAAHGAKTPQKAYKHLEVINFSSIKRVVDITETADCKNVFALITKQLNEEEKLLAFSILDDSLKKQEFLMTMSKSICRNMCRTDYDYLQPLWTRETLLTMVEGQVLNVDTSDIGNRTLSRAATKFGKRVSRAFSFNKTPRKLKRAMSSMTQLASPFSRRDSTLFANPNTMTPRSNLAALRLASTNDLTDHSMYENLYSELVDQMSIGTPIQKRRETLVTGDSPISELTSTPHIKSSTIGHAAGKAF